MPRKREWFKQMRKDRGMSMREVSESSGIGHNILWRFEAGQRMEVSLTMLDDLAYAFGVDIMELIHKELEYLNKGGVV